MFKVYILYSVIKDKYYVGQTEDLERRLAVHNMRNNMGTSDWELKYYESFETRSEAMKRESEIKSKKRRSYLEGLIKNQI
jgi:putative endonuclease